MGVNKKGIDNCKFMFFFDYLLVREYINFQAIYLKDGILRIFRQNIFDTNNFFRKLIDVSFREFFFPIRKSILKILILHKY